MNDNEQFDNVLDDALGEYREAEPLTGIEDRVLQRLRLQPLDRRNPWWGWVIAATCTAMLAFAVWLGLQGHVPQDPGARQQTEVRKAEDLPKARSASETPPTVTNQRASQPRSKIQPQVAGNAGTPTQIAPPDKRRESSHLPAPLTGEERQLLTLAQIRPDVLRALAHEDQPIEITPLTIQPLPSEANGDN